MSLRHLVTTIFDAGKLRPKCLLKKLFILEKSKIFIQNKYSFFQKSRIFIQTNIHFFKIQNIHSKKYSFFKSQIFIQKNIHFFERDRIGQGYPRMGMGVGVTPRTKPGK